MKNLLLPSALIFILSFCISSESLARPDSTCEKYSSGGFGHFLFGPAYLQTPNFTDYLKQSDILGASYSPSSVGYMAGGEGGGVMGRFIFGGGGYGIIIPSASTELGSAQVNVGGGYFKVGYKFYEKNNSFMFAYAAFGGSGYDIELSNFSDSLPMYFNHKEPIAPNEKANYSVGGFLFDLGVSSKTLPVGKISETKKEMGGLMLGIEIGALAVLPISEWSTSKYVVVGPPDLPQLFSPYIRITIGGGGFGFVNE